MKQLVILLALLCAASVHATERSSAARLAQLPAPGTPGAPTDARYCGEPARDKAGRIKRSRAALRQFVAVNPCPATLESATTCAGWVIDHTWPLAVGGCDAPHNMTWMTDAAAKDKDRWELKYFAVPRQKVK